MIEQTVLMSIDGQRSKVNTQLDLGEPLQAWGSFPGAVFGKLEPTDEQRFQLATGKDRKMVFEEGSPAFDFVFSEETTTFVATREDCNEHLIAARVDAKARAIKEGTGEWGEAIVQEMRIAVPFKMSESEFGFFERYVAWRKKNPL
jgi:hypothetical protein